MLETSGPRHTFSGACAEWGAVCLPHALVSGCGYFSAGSRGREREKRNKEREKRNKERDREMEFTLAEAESIDLAKKGVAEMLTVSAGGNTKLYKLHTVLFSRKSSLPPCPSLSLSQKPEDLEKLEQYRRKVARKKVNHTTRGQRSPCRLSCLHSRPQWNRSSGMRSRHSWRVCRLDWRTSASEPLSLVH